jgi:hypothetical protein
VINPDNEGPEMTHSFDPDQRNSNVPRDYAPPAPPAPAYYGHPTPAPKPNRRPFVVLAITAAVALLAIVLCAVGAAGSNDPQRQRTGRAAADARVTPTPTPDPTTSAPKVGGKPKPKAADPVDAPVVKPQKVTGRQWAKIARAPEKYVGKAYVVYGYVTQFDSATGDDAFRANVDGVRHTDEWEYETNSILSSDGNINLDDLVKDDHFRAEVLVAGEFSYESTMGADLAVPHLIITKLKRS